MRILVVDDDMDILTTMQVVLGMHSYNDVSTVTNGNDAAFLLSRPQHGYDLVILDINLPGMSGLDILDFLDTLDKDVKVVVVTGSTDCHYERDIRTRENVVGFVLKPFEVEYLINVVRDAEKELGRCGA